MTHSSIASSFHSKVLQRSCSYYAIQ